MTMKKKHKLRYSDLGKPEFCRLSGQVEIILTCGQAALLKRYNRAAVDSTPGFRSHFIYAVYHFRMLFTYPRLFHLGEYYDPEELDLAGFEAVDAGHVRLTFHNSGRGP